MNPIAATFLVGAMIVTRQWSKGDTVTIDNVVGIAGVALGLAVVGSMNKDLGRAFGLLVVVSVALFQLGPLLENVNPTQRGQSGGSGRAQFQ